MKKLSHTHQLNQYVEILETNKYILFYHFNNLSVKERINLTNIVSGDNVKIKVIKNKIFKASLEKRNILLDYTVSGPTLLIYGNYSDPVFNISNQLLKYNNIANKLILINGVFDQTITSVINYQRIRNSPSVNHFIIKLINQLYYLYNLLIIRLTTEFLLLYICLIHQGKIINDEK